MSPAGARVVLDAGLRARLAALARARYPAEACGFCLGRSEERTFEIVELREAANVAARPHAHFEIEPLELLLAEREARQRGLLVLGIWHSHPDRPARPSAADRRHAPASWVQLVVALDAHEPGEIRAWRTDAESVQELALTLEFPPSPAAAGTSDTRACRAGRP